MEPNKPQWVVGSYGNPLQSNIKIPTLHTWVSLTDKHAPCSTLCKHILLLWQPAIYGDKAIYTESSTPQSMQLYSQLGLVQ